MPQTKRKTTNRKKISQTKRKTNNKRKKQDNTVRYLIAVVVFIVLILGIFQLGIIGTMLDSFFNYLFGIARYYTYALIFIATGYIAFYKKIPRTRRTVGAILLQFTLVLIAQVIYHFTDGIKAEREPVLSFVYHAYDNTHFPNFGGGVTGYYLFELLNPLISMAGVVILALLLVVSSAILLLKKRHRDVSKTLMEQLKSSSHQASESFKDHRQKAKVKRDAKARVKVEQREQAAKDKKSQPVTDVSDLPEVPQDETTSSIPIYGHSDKDEGSETESTLNKRRVYDQEDTPSAKDEQGTTTQSRKPQRSTDAEERGQSAETSEATTSISDAGEVENAAYQIPPLTLLNEPKKQRTTSKSEVQQKGKLLETTMKNFGVNARVTQIKIGPAVTQYEIEPAQGVKVSKIVNLHNDIALALAAKDVRIEAPIPGKSAVGIEVPNEKISLVSLKEVLDAHFPSDNKLDVGLGRDISGDPIAVSLNDMPHLLVAGSTGSGKSVCINGIIVSILLNARPNEVKLMLIDPKMVELNVYNGIPHLLIPVVTNPHKASQALEKIVAEMERRYDLFQHTSTRNMEEYNAYIRNQNEELEEKQAELPYIVVIVDELADLMMVAGKDVENSIQRITQMARAAGIHLIVATQRPSVDVITGIIKNNIPSRIAFAVSSQTDSRTIINSSGAEKLLGKGDMLYVSNNSNNQTRIQGAFLSNQEVQAVVNHVVEQQKANYVKEMEPDAAVDKSEMKSEDSLYDEAYLFVIEQQKASTSLLQRQFRIGYNRASRLMDDLERNQVIGPQKGSKPRQILVDLNEDEV
ncbi:DNA translocase FtsK [Staphylococcus auricularis]|uniref:DNA translocase FtsK n=1 Tax=Staphylococcus auricularis TaxID=29379 RepID=UPI001932AEC5|nr:DNA translocase FtsK [Staphylococcus auricularis]MBM0867736.1 DNA translocase FtsK [Staphylococcus auricularis]